MRNDGRGHDWIVLLEAADDSGCSTIDVHAFRRLVIAYGTPAPTTLFTPGRYALQVTVQAPTAPRALSVAISRWRQAMSRCRLPDWELVRAEIMTPAELESDMRVADTPEDGLRPDEVVPAAHAAIDPTEEELLRRALFDPVTGLPCRELFLEEVRRALEAPPAAPSVRAVLVVHVDLPEQPAADELPADEVLAELAGRLTGSVREGDTVGRVGPSDFALLVELPAADDTDLLAGRVLDCLRWPAMEQQPPRPVASVGVAMATGGDADDLFEMAELAVVAAARRAGGDGGPRFGGGRGSFAGGTHDNNP